MKTRGVNVYCIGSKSENYGYLKIATRKANKTIVQSLNIKVLKKDFNKNTQRMRLNTHDADKINKYIDDKLKTLSFVTYNKSKITSICVFIQLQIDITNVKSTKQKYENVLTLFKEFLKLNYKKDDLYFEEIDTYVITNFRNYLLTKEVKNTNNTANYKLKTLKSFFSKLEKEQIYHYNVNCFSTLQMKFDDTHKNYLNLVELKELIKTDFADTRIRVSEIKYSLSDIKNAFVFSTLSQGLRISDIMTFRWNDFLFQNEDFDAHENLQISKKMIKTKKIVNIFINSFAAHFLLDNILRCSNEINATNVEYIERINNLNNQLEKKKSLQNIIDSDKLDKKNIERLNTIINNKNLKEVILTTKKLSDKLENNIDEIQKYKDELEKVERELFSLNQIIFDTIYKLIRELGQNKLTQTKFVFSFLSDNDFKNIDENNDFSQLTEKQFLKFQGVRSYVNKLLKDYIFSKLTTKKLSFHSARHTYTSLILSDDSTGLNIYDLMKSLGHTSITSTQKYMQGFNSKKLIDINNSLTDSINDI